VYGDVCVKRAHADQVIQCSANGGVPCSDLQCVAMCCNVLQCVAMCCSVHAVFMYLHASIRHERVAACCSASQCVAVC